MENLDSNKYLRAFKLAKEILISIFLQLGYNNKAINKAIESKNYDLINQVLIDNGFTCMDKAIVDVENECNLSQLNIYRN